jgi:two-component sensor histidine kinase
VRHRIHLSGGADAGSGARAAIDLLTVALLDGPGCYEIRLMVSELVANSVRHGGAAGADEDIELSVLVGPTCIRVECSDPTAGFEPPRSTDGYGLRIVRELADDWGTGHGPLGSTWFEYGRSPVAV